MTPKLLNQFRMLVGLESERWTNATEGPSIVVLDAFTGGGAQADHFRTEHHVQMADTLTWSSGRQAVKVGISVTDFSRRRWDDNTNRRHVLFLQPRGLCGRPTVFVRAAGRERPCRLS